MRIKTLMDIVTIIKRYLMQNRDEVDRVSK
jgi:hypothetical protein